MEYLITKNELDSAIEYLEQLAQIDKEYKCKPIKIKSDVNTKWAVELVLNELSTAKRMAEMNLKDAEEFKDNMCEHRCIKYNEIEELKSELYDANKLNKRKDAIINYIMDAYCADEHLCKEVEELYGEERCHNYKTNCYKCLYDYLDSIIDINN